jgi:methylglyoxal synthase
MKNKTVTMAEQKTIAIMAHDNKQQKLLAWAKFYRGALSGHKLIATGMTGKLLHRDLGFPVARLHSGSLGGDQQLGAKSAKAMSTS